MSQFDQLIKDGYNAQQQTFAIGYQKLGAEFFSVFAKHDWSKLKGLYIDGAELGDQGVKEILKIKFPKLQVLSLNRNGLTAKGIQYIAAAKLNINTLSIQGNPLGDEGLKVYSQLNLSNFTDLNLSETSITDSGLANFENVKLPEVKYINLNGNKVTTKGFRSLIKTNPPNLVSINFENTLIDDEIFKIFGENAIPKLQSFFPTHSEVNYESVSAFTESHPNVMAHWRMY